MTIDIFRRPEPVDPPLSEPFSTISHRNIDAIEDAILALTLLCVVFGFSVFLMWCVERVVFKTETHRYASKEMTPEMESTARTVGPSHFVLEQGRIVRRSPRYRISFLTVLNVCI